MPASVKRRKINNSDIDSICKNSSGDNLVIPQLTNPYPYKELFEISKWLDFELKKLRLTDQNTDPSLDSVQKLRIKRNRLIAVARKKLRSKNEKKREGLFYRLLNKKLEALVSKTPLESCSEYHFT